MVSSDEPVPVGEREVETTWSVRGEARKREAFLKGPIPLPPLLDAAVLPGRALHLYLAVHHRVAVTGATSVVLSSSYLRQWGIGKDAKSRALGVLEMVGLVEVERRVGRPTHVTLVITDGLMGGR
jgi:hypothetical protein